MTTHWFQRLRKRRRKGQASIRAMTLAATAAALLAVVMVVIAAYGESLVWDMPGLHEALGRLLAPAFLINIALILMGWQHYRKLHGEVEDRAKAAARARMLAMRDPLTGFHNRRSLAESGAELLVTALQRGRAMAMLLLDVDHFKNVNDIHGHAVGDGLLRSIAAEIARIAPPGAVMARLGGDEFACAFEVAPDDPRAAQLVAETLVARLGLPLKADGTHVHTSISLGISVSGPDCESVDQLLRRADIAMYVAKQRGRNGVAWFDASMEKALKKRSELEAKMRQGIPAGEFEPYFEQQVDLATGKLSGFEVLARWNHPVLGFITPAQFIPVAEETGLIGDLCFAVVRNAIARLGDNLSLPVTAEGVERKEIEDRLRALGINKGQGWLYGRPMALGAVQQLLAEKRLLAVADPLLDGHGRTATGMATPALRRQA